jgi:Ca2+-transporting ATPase
VTPGHDAPVSFPPHSETPADPSSVPWHALALDEVLRRLGSSADGLSEREAAHRRAHFGPNALRTAPAVSALRILLDQFRSVVVLLLLAAAALASFLRDPLEAGAILGVLVINAALGFATELRARGAMAALLRLEVPRATVLRDGSPREVDAHALVPGDVIVLEAGRAVPADARLLTSTELRTAEAALTGESLPVDKESAAALSEDAPLADRPNLVFMAVAIGMRTEVGRIGGLVAGIRSESTPLERRLDTLGRRLVWLTLAVVGIVVIEGVRRGQPLGRMLETGIALAIAAVPEGLAAVSTIALAVGVARMARRNALVRRLPTVEALGSATVVCADKTGTLTAGEMTVTALLVGGREYAVTGRGYRIEGGFLADGRPVDVSAEPALELALRAAALFNRAALLLDPDGRVGIRGDPTEAALLVAAAKAGFERDALLRRWPADGELPFSSHRMLMATAHRGEGGPALYVKGAPTRVVERCARVLGPGGPEPLDAEGRERELRHNRALAGRGDRRR